MLSDLPNLKKLLSIPLTDDTQDGKLYLLLPVADAVVKRYCKRSLETAIFTEYPLLRSGAEALVLEQTPVHSYRLSGNITSGQAQVTGLAATVNLLVGMPVLQAVSYNGPALQPFPNGTTIQSIDSSTQVTLSGNATQTQNAVPFVFGLAVWYDPQGSYGDGLGSDPSGPFGPTSLLRAGLDYALQRELPDGSSKSGKLTRLASMFGYLGMAGSWGAYGNAWAGLQSRGTLSSWLPPLWPMFPPGSIKVVYSAGLGAGAVAPNGLLPSNTTLPADLTAATSMVAAWLWRNADNGGIQYQSESFQGYSANLANAVDAVKQDAELGSVRQILSRWRRVSL